MSIRCIWVLCLDTWRRTMGMPGALGGQTRVDSPGTRAVSCHSCGHHEQKPDPLSASFCSSLSHLSSPWGRSRSERDRSEETVGFISLVPLESNYPLPVVLPPAWSKLRWHLTWIITMRLLNGFPISTLIAIKSSLHTPGTEGMAQLLRALAPLLQDMGSVPSTDMAANNLWLEFQRIQHPLLVSTDIAHKRCTDIYPYT